LHLHDAILLFFAALAAGALNAVAGGGSFIAFPSLIFTGMQPIAANATNTCALWPGTLASATAYRTALRGRVHTLAPLLASGIVGGAVGSFVLLHTPQRTFLKLVPWFLLCATLLFTFSKRINRVLRLRTQVDHETSVGVIGGAFMLLIISIYIGYFGAGAGILLLAMLALLGETDIHVMNGMKTMLATVANGTALVMFIFNRAVVWPQALLMLVGASIGGYTAAWYSQKIDPRITRGLVIVTGFAMAAWFFIR
jgi:uncharacterized membrane protein YfcA